MNCVLKDMGIKSDFFVNVTTRIWNGTFAAVRIDSTLTYSSSFTCSLLLLWNGVFSLPHSFSSCLVSEQSSFQSTVLTVSTEIETSEPELLVIAHKHLTVLE